MDQLLVDFKTYRGGRYCESCLVSGSSRGRSTSTDGYPMPGTNPYKYCIYAGLRFRTNYSIRDRNRRKLIQLTTVKSMMSSSQKMIFNQIGGVKMLPRTTRREKERVLNDLPQGSNSDPKYQKKVFMANCKFPDFQIPPGTQTPITHYIPQSPLIRIAVRSSFYDPRSMILTVPPTRICLVKRENRDLEVMLVNAFPATPDWPM